MALVLQLSIVGTRDEHIANVGAQKLFRGFKCVVGRHLNIYSTSDVTVMARVTTRVSLHVTIYGSKTRCSSL